MECDWDLCAHAKGRNRWGTLVTGDANRLELVAYWVAECSIWDQQWWLGFLAEARAYALGEFKATDYENE